MIQSLRGRKGSGRSGRPDVIRHKKTEGTLSRTCKQYEELSRKVTTNMRQPYGFSVSGGFTQNDLSPSLRFWEV